MYSLSFVVEKVVAGKLGGGRYNASSFSVYRNQSLRLLLLLFFCFHSLGSFLSISILLLSYFFLFLCYFFLSLSVFFLFFFFSSSALLFLSFLPSSSALSTPVQSWHKGKVDEAAPVQPPQDHLRGISPLFSPRGKPRVRA